MDIRLATSDFVDNRYEVEYGSKKATFILLDEEFAGVNNLGVIKRINIIVETYDDEGTKTATSYGTSIIGVGDTVVGIISDDAALNGQILSGANMTSCLVRLYE